MKSVFNIFILYAFIFNPVLAGLDIGMIKFLYPLLLISLINGNLKTKLGATKKLRMFFYYLLIYVLFKTLLGADFTFLYVTFITFIEVIIMPLYVLERFKDKNLLKEIIQVGCIASVISMLCLIVPFIKKFVDNMQIVEESLVIFSFRGFGFAEGRTFYYSITLATLLVVGLLLRIRVKTLLVLLPAFLIAIFFNARVGILVLLIGITILFLKYKMWRKPFIWISISLVSLIFYFVIEQISSQFQDSFMFALDGILQIKDVLLGTSSAEGDTYGALQQAIVYPNGFLSWVFGDGYNVLKEVRNCDSGYNNQLIYGGIIYMILIYLVYLYQICKSYEKKHALLFAFLVLIVFVANFKGNLMSTNGSYRTIMLLLLYCQFNKYLPNKIDTVSKSVSDIK